MTNQAVAEQAEVHAPRAIDVFKANLDKAAATIMPLLPAHITPEKFKSMVITTIAYNPKLQECTPLSLLRATADAAELGLSLNPNMRECDILPVWSRDGTVAQCRPRYTGLMKLARQSGDIVDIYSHEVYSNDEFTYEYGLDKKLVHKPAAGDRGELTFAYCVWKSRDGEKGFEVVDKKRIDRAKNSSEGYKAFKAGKIKSTPWGEHEAEMWRKTAVRAASKYLPQVTENEAFRKALALSDDTAFDDDLPMLASDAPPPSPRPQRIAPAEATPEALDKTRKEGVALTEQYRQTMAGSDADSGTPTVTLAGDADEATAALVAEIKAKIAAVKGAQMLGSIEKDYESDMLDLPEAAQAEVRDAIEARRAEFGKR